MIWKQRIKKFHLKVESQGRDDSGGQVKPFLQVGVSTRRLLPGKQNNLLTSVRIERKAFKCNFLFSRIQTVWFIEICKEDLELNLELSL